MTFFEAHRALLDQAVAACRTRGYWSAYPEIASGKIYGETAKADGEAAFKALLGKPFDLGQPGGKTRRPGSIALRHAARRHLPAADVATLIKASRTAGEKWASGLDRGPRRRYASRSSSASTSRASCIANAVMHTTGQGFMMAFQAGGPHAQDRALEAVAYAYDEMKRVPANASWSKPQGKADPLVLDKNWRIVPRGISLVIGCATFPTWNGYPAIFASLATGNSVIVKPHPGAILPLAITVKIAREVLKEAGFDPNVIMLAADNADAPVAKDLVTHPDIAIVDFTGSSAFGRWVRENAATDVVFTEEAGVNSIVINSTSDFRGLCSNIAFSLSLYSGQMCTAPQNIFVPAAGIETNDGKKSFDEVAAALRSPSTSCSAIRSARPRILGAVQNEATIKRVNDARGTRQGRARFHRPCRSPVSRKHAPRRRSFSPSTPRTRRAWGEERFGPIAFVIETGSAADAIALASGSAKKRARSRHRSIPRMKP